jgi:membrane carboxypeptidase/penicillin-binding protein
MFRVLKFATPLGDYNYGVGAAANAFFDVIVPFLTCNRFVFLEEAFNA